MIERVVSRKFRQDHLETLKRALIAEYINCQRVRPSGRPEGQTRRQIIEPREDMYTRKKSQKRSKV